MILFLFGKVNGRWVVLNYLTFFNYVICLNILHILLYCMCVILKYNEVFIYIYIYIHKIDCIRLNIESINNQFICVTYIINLN